MEEQSALVFVPEENISVSFKVTEEKPFNKCFQCHSFRNGCSGPNLSIMGVERACEFLQMARIFLKLSYQDVADGSGISLATVKRILTGKISDPSFYTMSAISIFLLGDPHGKYPCAIPNLVSNHENDTKLSDALRELERALDDNKDYRAALDNIHVSYKAEMEAFRAEYQKDIDHLHKQIERAWADIDRARAEADGWKAENDRKGKFVDKYIDKLLLNKIAERTVQDD